MQQSGLLEKHGIGASIRPLADSGAGQVALLSGAVDVILSDLIWASAQRTQGKELFFVPFSLAVGGLVMAAKSTTTDLADLKGRTIGIGGGPLDKNLVFLRACYQRQTGHDLLENITPKYGAAPVIHQLLLRGHLDGALNFWQWNVRAVHAGARSLISVAEMLTKLGVPRPPPLLGWTFTQQAVDTRRDGLVAFLDASFDTKQQLLRDDAIWLALRPLMDDGGDEMLFRALRDGYRAGIIEHFDPADTEAMDGAFRILSQYGGAGATGGATAFDTQVVWKGYHR